MAKVQRPGIHKTIDVDLEIMLHLASLMERHLEEAELHRPTKIVEEFAHTLERELGEFMDLHFYRPLKELDLGKLLRQVLDMASKHRLRVPPDLFLMLKALSTVEGLGRTLDPDFDMTTQAAPSIRRIQRERLHPRRVAADMFDTGAEFVHLLKEIPRELPEILKQAR